MLSVIRNLSRAEVAMKQKMPSTVKGAAFRITVLLMHTKRLDTRQISARLLIQMPTRPGNLTELALWKKFVRPVQHRRSTGFRRNHTLKFKAEDPKRIVVSSQ